MITIQTSNFIFCWIRLHAWITCTNTFTNCFVNCLVQNVLVFSANESSGCAWIRIFFGTAKSNFKIGTSCVLGLFVVDAPKTLAVVHVSDFGWTPWARFDLRLDGSWTGAYYICRESVLVLPISSFNRIISIKPDSPFISFRVTCSFGLFGAAKSNFEIGTVPVSLFIINTPETKFKIDMGYIACTRRTRLSRDCNWIFTNLVSGVIVSGFVVSFAGWVITIEPVGPFVPFNVTRTFIELGTAKSEIMNLTPIWSGHWCYLAAKSAQSPFDCSSLTHQKPISVSIWVTSVEPKSIG